MVSEAEREAQCIHVRVTVIYAPPGGRWQCETCGAAFQPTPGPLELAGSMAEVVREAEQRGRDEVVRDVRAALDGVTTEFYSTQLVYAVLARHAGTDQEQAQTALLDWIERGEVGTGAGEGAPRQDTGSAWVTRSADCPEAPAQAHLPARHAGTDQ